MNKLSTSFVALLAVFGTANMALAITTSAFEASVSVLSPDATGFNLIGQTQVNGLGSSSVVLSRQAAELSVTGNAESVLDVDGSGDLSGVSSDSSINSALNFAREIETSGSLVGQGNVIASGTAIGSIGTAGAASASTSAGGTDTNGEGSATADASAMGSLNGAVSTVNTLQLLGTNGLFAGSNGLTVGEQNVANAYGASSVSADGVTGVDLTTASLSAAGSLGLMAGIGNGALFAVTSELTSVTSASTPTAGIELSVSNAGNGTISLATSTGGFFTGGGFADGSATFANNGFFQ